MIAAIVNSSKHFNIWLIISFLQGTHEAFFQEAVVALPGVFWFYCMHLCT